MQLFEERSQMLQHPCLIKLIASQDDSMLNFVKQIVQFRVELIRGNPLLYLSDIEQELGRLLRGCLRLRCETYAPKTHDVGPDARVRSLNVIQVPVGELVRNAHQLVGEKVC